jgi:hypothetical protein
MEIQYSEDEDENEDDDDWDKTFENPSSHTSLMALVHVHFVQIRRCTVRYGTHAAIVTQPGARSPQVLLNPEIVSSDHFAPAPRYNQDGSSFLFKQRPIFVILAQ